MDSSWEKRLEGMQLRESSLSPVSSHMYIYIAAHTVFPRSFIIASLGTEYNSKHLQGLQETEFFLYNLLIVELSASLIPTARIKAV